MFQINHSNIHQKWLTTTNRSCCEGHRHNNVTFSVKSTAKAAHTLPTVVPYRKKPFLISNKDRSTQKQTGSSYKLFIKVKNKLVNA